MTTDIPIKYINTTDNPDFEVVVFTQNFAACPPNTYVAWQVLKGQGPVEFTYPVSMSVGATYQSSGQTVMVGPFPTKPSSTWTIKQESPSDKVTLTQKTDNVDVSAIGTIVVWYVSPPAYSRWSGGRFDAGIYKSDRLLLARHDISTDNCIAEFLVEPKLSFGCVRNMKVGDIFTIKEIHTSLREINLNEFPNGVTVIFEKTPSGNSYRLRFVDTQLQ